MLSSAPTVVELFAGAGLFGFAFRQAGFRLTHAIEIDSVASATYALNLGDHIETADIARVQPKGRCDVLIAGPPCQGFSTLGHRRADDPRNNLSLEVVRWTKALKPSVIVIENVAAFLMSPIWSKVSKQLTRLGYEVNSFVLNAHDYGCPQLRVRSFTIAHRTGQAVSAPRKRNGLSTVREAWYGLPKRPDGRNHHIAPKPSEMALARMRLIPRGGDKRDIMTRAPELAPPSWWNVSCEATDAWGRMELDEPSNTLRTCLQNPSKGRYIHPSQNRVISIREAARLHSIPDNWTFHGLPTQVARQIGNSVPPALGRAIANCARKLLA